MDILCLALAAVLALPCSTQEDPLRTLADLEDPARAPAAARELAKLPAERVLGPLLDLLETSEALRRPETRIRAYELLASLADVHGPAAEVADERQVRQLVAGLREETPGIRILSARALGRVGAEHRAAVIDELLAALEDRNAMVVATAASSLARFGSQASRALARLGDLLVQGPLPGAFAAGRAAPTGADEALELDRTLEEHLARTFRANLALARLGIAGTLTPGELALYRGLAATDQDGPAIALAAWLGAPHAISPEPTVLVEAVRFVASCAEDNARAVPTRQELLRGLARLLTGPAPLPDEARARATDALLVGSVDEDETLRALALALLERLP